MNSSCPNCNAKLSCGCQKRSASNGAQGCTNCITSLELSLKSNPGSSSRTPSNVKVLFTPPKK